MTRAQQLYCSFCGKGQQECEWLLAGPYPAIICDTCIADAASQLARIRQDKIEHDALIMEAKRCAFCLPAAIAREGGFNGR